MSAADAARADASMRSWRTLDLLCAGHWHRRDFTPAQRRAADALLRERGYPRPVVWALRFLTAPSIHDVWDGGATVPDVLRGWGGVLLIVTAAAVPWAVRLGGPRVAKPLALAGGGASLLLLALAAVGKRRGRRTPPGGDAPAREERR